MSDVLRTHVTNDMWDNNRKVGLGGSRAGYSPVVVQQVGDAHQVVGEHGGAHQDLEMRAAFERAPLHAAAAEQHRDAADRKSTRLNSSHDQISYAVFCLKKKNNTT